MLKKHAQIDILTAEEFQNKEDPKYTILENVKLRYVLVNKYRIYRVSRSTHNTEKFKLKSIGSYFE